MNVLEMTTFLRGGAGVLTVSLAESLSENGHNVTVISSGQVEDLSDWTELTRTLEEKKIEHYTFNVFKRSPESVWESVYTCADILKQRKFDVIHVHAGVPAFIVHMAQKILNISIPTLATFHSWSVGRPNWMNIADIAAFNMCNLIIYDSKEYLRIGREHGVKSKDKVIYPYVNNQETSYVIDRRKIKKSLVNKYKLPHDAVIISNLAELTERKGQIDLIEVVKNVRDSGINSYLFLIGESKNSLYLDDINNRIKELELESFVIKTGWLENPYDLIAISNLFIFPSYSEGLGMAIIEAIKFNIPTVFSNIEGMKDIEDILGEHCFGTFNPGEIDSITQTVLDVFKMSEEHKTAKVIDARNIVNEHFNYRIMTKEYEGVLLDLINTRG